MITKMKLLGAAMIAFGFAFSSAQAADVKQICMDIALSDGVAEDKANAGCDCVAGKIGSNGEQIATLEKAQATATGPARDAVYTPDLVEIDQACGPWQ